MHWENKDLCHCSMDVSWLHDIAPSKIKSNLNCCCQLTCDDWGIPNTKLKCCQCTSAALLCCKNTLLFNCTWQIMTHEWWIWIVLFIPRCYQTSFLSGGCFCAFNGSGGSMYTGSLNDTMISSGLLIPQNKFVIQQFEVFFHNLIDFALTHYCLVTLYDAIDLGQHWLRLWHVSWRRQATIGTKIESSVAFHAAQLSW